MNNMNSILLDLEKLYERAQQVYLGYKYRVELSEMNEEDYSYVEPIKYKRDAHKYYADKLFVIVKCIKEQEQE